ncbi:hypothetical protein E4U55_006747 [Claviceps digitariae]|nr:hypothetical protein E4U55_006747 [Claviceps digitariae]
MSYALTPPDPSRFPTWFCLVDIEPEAADIIRRPKNTHLLFQLRDGRLALRINFGTLHYTGISVATMGRSKDATVYVGRAGTSKIQCCFELDHETNMIMFYDRSSTETTTISGEYEVWHSAFMRPPFNYLISMGRRGDEAIFQVLWPWDCE